MKTIANSWESN